VFDSLLEKVAIALDSERLPYMVIGGQAASAAGRGRCTQCDEKTQIFWT